MNNKVRERLTNLDFYYIKELRPGLYEKHYAKKQADNPKTKAHIVEDDRVAFWDNSGEDHACVIKTKDILLII